MNHLKKNINHTQKKKKTIEWYICGDKKIKKILVEVFKKKAILEVIAAFYKLHLIINLLYIHTHCMRLQLVRRKPEKLINK